MSEEAESPAGAATDAVEADPPTQLPTAIGEAAAAQAAMPGGAEVAQEAGKAGAAVLSGAEVERVREMRKRLGLHVLEAA